MTRNFHPDDAHFEPVTSETLVPDAGVRPTPTVIFQKLEINEIILMSIKPSLWYIPIVAARGVLIGALLLMLGWMAAREGQLAFASTFLGVGMLVVVARLAVAALQWASRLYVLTNRRVIHFSGTLNVRIGECRLLDIGRTKLDEPPWGAALRIGSIHMTRFNEQHPAIAFEEVQHPEDVHNAIVKAIRKAQNHSNGV